MSFKLLPKSTEEFSDTKFWEGFFKTRGSKAFEWYGEYQDMMDLWAQYVKSGDRVLNIGCGNSNLGAELHDRQGCDVLCIDTSDTVVQQMTRKHNQRPRLAYRVMDAASLTDLEDASFACAVDKGTLDALMSSSDSAEGVVDNMLAEVHRILRIGGRHLIVSLCQRQVVDKLLQHILARSWIARIHQATAASASDSSGFPLPVFFIVLTKLRPPAAPASIVSSIVQVQDAYSTGPPERLDSIPSLAEWIRQVQLTAYSLSRPTKNDSATQFSYVCGRTGLSTFSCHLLTHPTALSRRRSGYAVFIEPLSSASSSSSGMSHDQRSELLDSQANLRRLLFVRLHPWLYYQSDSALQASLSRLVMAFAPRPDMPESDVSFLSTGKSAYHYQTVASKSGYIVEQSSSNDDLRLLKPDSELSPLLCRANTGLLKSDDNIADIVTESGDHSLSRLLDALICDNATSAFINWPWDLDWLLKSKRRRVECPLPSLHCLLPSPAVSLLLKHFSMTWCNQLPSRDDSAQFKLVAVFPPADSLAAYSSAMSSESIDRLAGFVDNNNGCLLLATRLFDKKPAVADVNARAVDSLRQCGQFVSVCCAKFFELDCASANDAAESERRRCWIACASATADSADRVVGIISDLPGVQFISKS